MDTIRLAWRCGKLTRDDLKDLRDLHQFISEMADENVRNRSLRLIEAVCLAIERLDAAQTSLECIRLEAANESTLFN
jgi:hypothetical protein